MATKLNHAVRLYLMRFTPAMILYVVILLGENWIFRDGAPTGPLAYAVAIAPALAIIGVIAAMGLYLVDETDEYMRMQHAKAIVIATGLTLSIACVWGFLEDFHLAPHLPAYWAFVVFCAGLGLARGVIKWIG